jgi:hypothetical protein
VFDKRADNLPRDASSLHSIPTFFTLQYVFDFKCSQNILALEALKKDPKVSLSATAKLYSVPYTAPYDRRAGRPARHDLLANSRRLTDSEEKSIVQYVLELDARSFPPRLRGVEDTANYLLHVRDAPPVGKRWAHNLVKRQPQLRTRYTRRYDYQRAKCGDPMVIGERFAQDGTLRPSTVL